MTRAQMHNLIPSTMLLNEFQMELLRLYAHCLRHHAVACHHPDPACSPLHLLLLRPWPRHNNQDYRLHEEVSSLARTETATSRTFQNSHLCVHRYKSTPKKSIRMCKPSRIYVKMAIDYHFRANNHRYTCRSCTSTPTVCLSLTTIERIC